MEALIPYIIMTVFFVGLAIVLIIATKEPPRPPFN